MILVVDDRGSLQGGHAPEEEDTLEEPVKGDPSDQQVWEELQDWEKCEYDPVHEPLRVVVLGAALQGLDRAVGGVNESDEVAQQLGAEAEHQPQGHKGNHAWNY